MPHNGIDALLETLLAVVARDPAAKFRLRDILPFEISLVDRAANKRRFLTVKRNNGANTMITLQKVDLPAEIRESVLKVLTESLDQLMGITKAVTEGGEVTEKDATVPEDFQAALSAVLEQLGGTIPPVEKVSNIGTEAGDKLKAIAAAIATIAEAGSPDEVGGMIERLVKLTLAETKEAATLKALGELSIALTAEKGENGELPQETVEKVSATIAALSELVGTPEPVAEPVAEPKSEPAAKADEPSAEPTVESEPIAEPAAKTDEPVTEPSTEPTPEVTPAEPAAKTVEPVVESVVEPEPTPEPAAKTDEPAVEPTPEPESTPSVGDDTVVKTALALAETVAEVAKVGAKMSHGRLSRLRSALKALTDLVEELDPSAAKVVEPEPTPAEPVAKNDGDPEPTPPEPEDITKRIKELEERVSTLLDRPAAPASRRVDGDTGAGNKSSDPAPESQHKSRWIA